MDESLNYIFERLSKNDKSIESLAKASNRIGRRAGVLTLVGVLLSVCYISNDKRITKLEEELKHAKGE